MRSTLIALSVVAVAGVGGSACASKKFVNTQVSQVSGKVDTVSQALEGTQERVKQNETRIVEVDGKAAAAQTSANQADTKAVTANTAAMAANAKAVEVEKASKRILYDVVLNENEGNFKLGGSALPDQAKAKLDEMVTAIKADPKGAYFEIEGHTDSSGNTAGNTRLGLERAEVVKRYLHETHQIPLHRMNVISYGETKPSSDNKTREGRAENRRVVIRVLA